MQSSSLLFVNTIITDIKSKVKIKNAQLFIKIITFLYAFFIFTFVLCYDIMKIPKQKRSVVQMVNERISALVFDMDGTIADLEGQKNWIERLRSCDPTPYLNAKPFYDMDKLNNLLQQFKNLGTRIEVVSWRSMVETPCYAKQVELAKKMWLNKYHFPADAIHIVAYGQPKNEYVKHISGHKILIDDNQKVRDEWDCGNTIDATKNILKILQKLLDKQKEIVYNSKCQGH